MCGSHDSSLYVRYLCCWGIAGTVIVNINVPIGAAVRFSHSNNTNSDNWARIRIKSIVIRTTIKNLWRTACWCDWGNTKTTISKIISVVSTTTRLCEISIKSWSGPVNLDISLLSLCISDNQYHRQGLVKDGPHLL